MTLATADEFGRPWAAPVWFAHDAYRELLWVSAPDARHSRNIAERAQVSIVVFDSQVAANEGQAVYMSARVEQLDGDAAGDAIAVYSRRSQDDGAGPWSAEDVGKPGGPRLYRATVSEHWILENGDKRAAVDDL